jgi:prevent-host-death family protein
MQGQRKGAITMSREVGLYEAKTHLSELVEAAAGGEEIVITKHGKPMARLAPVAPDKPRKRELGCWRGMIWTAPDFDQPLPEDMIASMYGEDPGNPFNETPSR